MNSESERDIPKSSAPYGSANRTLVEQIGAIPDHRECLSCRIIGAGAFAGVGTYALWQSRAAAQGSPGQKRIVAGLGVGEKYIYIFNEQALTAIILSLEIALLIGSVVRWRQCKLLQT